jgi:hypothetical protein
VQESDLVIRFHTARLMAGEQVKAGTINTEKNNRIFEVDQNISQQLH